MGVFHLGVGASTQFRHVLGLNVAEGDGGRVRADKATRRSGEAGADQMGAAKIRGRSAGAPASVWQLVPGFGAALALWLTGARLLVAT